MIFGRKELTKDFVRIAPKYLLYIIIPALYSILNGMDKISLIPAVMYENNSVFFTTKLGYFFDGFVKPFVQIAVALFVAHYVCFSKNPDKIVYFISAGASILGLTLLVVLATKGMSISALAASDAGTRNTLSFSGMHANGLALMFNLCLCMLLFSVKSIQSVSGKLFVQLSIAICSLMVAFTFSRTAMVTLALIYIVFLFSNKDFMILFCGFFTAVLVLMFLPDAFYNRLFTGFSSNDAHAISAGRFDMIWMPLLRVVFDHIIFGNGIYSIMWSPPLLSGAMLMVGHAHNMYLNALLDQGVIGLLCFICFYVAVFKRASVIESFDENPVFKGVAKGVKLAILVLAIQGLTGDSLMPSQSQVFLWCGIGVIFGRIAYLNRVNKN
jgi:hypothetical protein